MTRTEVYDLIDKERYHQSTKWSKDWDDKNTQNDWVAYISHYLGKAVSTPEDSALFRKNILKVGALAVAVLEREDYSKKRIER